MTQQISARQCRILAFDHSSELGGAEIGLLNLADELGGQMALALMDEGPFATLLRGHRLEPYILDPGGSDGTAIRRNGDVVYALNTLREQAIRMRPRLLAALRQTGAEVLVCNTLRSAVLVGLCRPPKTVRRVVMVRDGLRPPYLTQSRAIASRAVVAAVGSVAVANSSWTADSLWPVRPLHVMPPVVAREFFSAYSPRPFSATPRVLLLGRIARWKGQLLGLKASTIMRADQPWRLTVAGGAWFGEDRYLQEVLDFAASMDKPKPDIVGHVSDVRRLIDDHDIVLHTSTAPEPFGQIIVQAMARGRVIIASGEGGPAEIVTDGMDGLLYDPRDVSSLARVLSGALADAAARRRLGDAGRTTALNYHPDRTVSKFLEIVSLAGQESFGSAKRRQRDLFNLVRTPLRLWRRE